MYHGMCGVRYHETSPMIDGNMDGDHMPHHGGDYPQFMQEVTIDDLKHERIEVPNIGDARSATVLHDFNKVCGLLTLVAIFI